MYASRPLPHLIGTAEFFSDETLGLIEIDGKSVCFELQSYSESINNSHIQNKYPVV